MKEIIDIFKDVVTKKYAMFTGRAGRKEFWYYMLVQFLLICLIGILYAIFGEFFYILMNLVSLALLLPSLAVGVRRLHDIGKDWYWILIALIPIIGGIWLIVLYAKAGMPGSNQFGAAPVDNNSNQMQQG